MSKKLFKPFIRKFEELVKEEGYESITDFINKWITDGKTFQTLHQYLLLKDIEFERQTVYAALRPYLTVPYDAPSSFWNKWNSIAETKGFDNIDDMMEAYKKKYTNTEIANELGVTTRTIEYLSIRMIGDRNLSMRELVKEKRPSHRDEDGFTKTDVKEKWNKLLNEKGFKSLREATDYYITNKISPSRMAEELGVTEKALRGRLEKARILFSKETEAMNNHHIISIHGGNNMSNNNDEIEQEDIVYEIPLAKRKIVNQPSEPTIISLCDRVDKGKIEVRADFQRLYVWEKKPAIKSRLIESVILNVPIPAIYTSEDENTGKEMVIDGQQRILTFHGFIKNKFKLKGLSVLSELNGYYYKDLSNLKDKTIKRFTDELGDLQESICDRPIRVIKILKESHPDIKFEIFERLNRGSVKLNDQELRNCIYRGNLNELIKILVKNKDFQRLQGLNEEHLRMLDAERILRFFAFCDKSERNYKDPLKKFLNDYMQSKQNINQNEIVEKEELFKKCVELCQTVFGKTAFRRIFPGKEDKVNGYVDDSLNQGIFDIQMYGFMEYQKRDIVPKAQNIMEAFADLVTSNNNFIETIEIGTYATKQVKKRTEMWINKLREIVNYPSDDKRLFTYEDKKRLYESNKVCAICKNEITFIEDAHVDHMVRFSDGGKTEFNNGRLTHRYCNLHRG